MRTKTAKKWALHEASLVAIPADSNARTRQHEGGGRSAVNRSIRELGVQCGISRETVDALVDSEATIEQARETMLNDMTTRSAFSIRGGTDYNSPEEQQRTLSDALYSKMTGTAPSERARPIAHRRTLDLMADSLRAAGVQLRDDNPASVISAMQTRAAGLHTTSDFAIAMANTSNRRLGELFRAAESGASAIVAAGTVNDFRPVTEARMTSFPSLEKVNEAGEISFGTMEEEGEVLAIASYARAIAMSFQVLVNDDLGAVDRSLRDIAFATSTLKGKLIVAALGATLADTKTLFHADHSNLADTPAALAEGTLDEGRIAMMRQTAPGSTEPLGIAPTVLLVPPELQITAEKMVATINPATSDAVNVFAGKLQVAVEPRLGSDTEWYLFAAPGTYPVIRFVTLAGFEAPVFETSDEFTRLGSSYRVHWHCGAGPTDHRGAWMNAGA